MDLKFADLKLEERYKLLASLVIPRPIAWISTVNAAGINNCAPYSFFNVFCEDPPLCVISFGPRKDGRGKDSLKNILDTGEFVVNLVEEHTANAMHISSYEIEPEESEFEQTGLTPAPSVLVRHPRIAEATVCFECRVFQTLEPSPARVIVLGEIMLVHAKDGVIDPVTKRINEGMYHPIGRLYANRYCTTRQRFELPGELPPT